MCSKTDAWVASNICTRVHVQQIIVPLVLMQKIPSGASLNSQIRVGTHHGVGSANGVGLRLRIETIHKIMFLEVKINNP